MACLQTLILPCAMNALEWPVKPCPRYVCDRMAVLANDAKTYAKVPNRWSVLGAGNSARFVALSNAIL
jgi:hypothetical protein